MKEKMKPFLVPFLSVLLGAGLVLGALAWKPEWFVKITRQTDSDETGYSVRNHRKFFGDFDDIFDKDFFGQRDPFEEMRKMREKMEKRFDERNPSIWSSPFDSWFKDRFGGGSVEDISRREDSDFVYFDVKVKSVDGTSIQANVEQGHLTITGKIQQEPSDSEEDSSIEKHFSSRFRRTFPLPENVDTKKMEMLHDKDRFTIKFPKLKT